MDFRNRGLQSPAPQPAGHTPLSSPSASSNQTSKFSKRNFSKWFEIGSILLLFSVTILVIAVAGLLYSGGTDPNKAVMKDKYQAVFLNNGQVYFGNIKNLGEKYLNLQNIYYLQTSGTGEQAATAATNVSLVKLGCELHAPYDKMIINNDQIIFWENLQSDSQVVKAIDQYKQENPDGQKCSAQSQNSTQQAPSTSTQSNTTPTTTTPAPSTSTKKP